jgi:hydrogenase/urease accessory protein HupE
MFFMYTKRCIRFFMIIVVFGALLSGIPLGAQAHMSTVGYSDINISDKNIHYRLYLDPSEVSQWVDSQSKKVFVIGEREEEKTAKPAVSWTDEEILPFVETFLLVSSNGETGKPSIETMTMEKRQDASYVRIDINYSFSQPVDLYVIKYNFFFDVFDPLHQNFSTLHIGDTQIEKVFNQTNRELTGKVETTSSGTITTEITIPSWLNTMLEYVLLGLEHIWTGYDHLVFVAALVLLKQRLNSYIKIITAFTVGHSITIVIAALDIITIPATIIEPLIALSIIYVAVENIWLKKLQWRWLLALGFGLIHGFGFAQVLQGSLGEQFVLSLFSFNLGVEIGQITVLAILLPLLILVSRWKWYRQAAYSLSVIIAAVGVYWLIERTLL